MNSITKGSENVSGHIEADFSRYTAKGQPATISNNSSHSLEKKDHNEADD